jgi:hypothetical protein
VILRLGVAALLLLPTAAFAQGNPGPFGGLFGRTPERTGSEFTAIDFRNAFAAQYEDALRVDDAIPEDELPQSGYTSGVNTGLVFERASDRLLFKAHGGATYQEYYRQPVFGATSYDAGVMVRGKPATRLQVHGQAAFVRSPFFRLIPASNPADSVVVVPGDAFVARLLTHETYNVGGGFTSQYSKRSSLSVTAMQRETRFGGADPNTFSLVGMEARWNRQLNRSFGVHAGYGRERIRQSALPDASFIYELIDVGIDFNRQLSLSRRTSLAFTTETAAVKRPLTGRRYRLNGHASLTKHFARTWRASAGVTRNTEFIPGFFEPLFTDAVNAMFSGMLSMRAEWQTTFSAGKGRFGFDNDGRYTTSHMTSRLNWALTRHLGIYGQYSVYYYKLPPTPTGFVLPNQLSRQAFAVGLNTWIPILNKVRAPRDPE